MELRQLKMFVHAAKTLSFSEAARKSCVTQSTLSLNIKQLEDELDITLFDRNNHGVFLTEAGQEMLEYAKKTIRAAEECQQHVSDIKQAKSGTLSIGVTNTFIPMVTQVLSEFSKLYPGIYINLKQSTAGELMKMLHNHDIDMALSYSFTDDPETVESVPLYTDHLAVIIRSNHTLAKNDTVKLSDLTKYNFALPAKNIISRRRLDQLLRDKKISLNIRMEIGMAVPLVHIVSTTNLLTVLSTSSLQALPMFNLKAVKIDEEGSDLQACFHTLKGTYRKHAVKEILRLLLENVKFHKI